MKRASSEADAIMLIAARRLAMLALILLVLVWLVPMFGGAQ
jgi:hypothetical protein